jgi:hypothetical protein
MNTLLPIHVEGHVEIRDKSTGEVLLSKQNAIHPKNMATAIARGLSNSENYSIFKLKLGNRGTYINGTQQIVFQPPIVSGDDADLYNPTYVEVVDDADAGVGVGNSVVFTNIPASTNTRVIVTCVVSANEAFDNPVDTSNSGQITTGPDVGDVPTGPNGINSASPFFFDELGLFTKQTSGSNADLDPSGELMLSHLIFSPIEHTGNRELVIVYSLTISVS